MKRPSKINNLMSYVHEKLESVKYLYVGHAQQRLQERAVSRLEVKQVLKAGHHEKKR
jgi:hypothetical protein